MTADELLASITAGRAPFVLDVRSRREYDAGHVPGAEHAPFWKPAIAERARARGAQPNQPIVVYCGHGPRAYIAGGALRRGGFEHVGYLDGHWSGWQRAGLPEAK